VITLLATAVCSAYKATQIAKDFIAAAVSQAYVERIFHRDGNIGVPE